VRRADIETGEVLELKTIPESAFGEGLVFMREETKRAKKNSLIQLVWKSSRAFTHEIKDIGGKVEEKNNALLFQEESGEQKMFNTDLRDGWGVTSSEREGVIVISNGTAHLTLFDMNKGQSVGFITVHDNGVEQRFPNELEAVRGEIWANILEKECVARINERTGKVLGWIDFTGLKKLQDNVGSVMNGIAYDERRDRIFVTGKQWRRVFEVKISKGSRKKGAIELGRKRCHSPTSLPNYGYP
jgi:glutamine cyclotransferase